MNLLQDIIVKHKNTIIEDFSHNFLLMQKNTDTKCPEYLEIKLNSDIDKDEFDNICRNVCLEMQIGVSKILNIPLKFMILLKKYEICDDKFYISIPFMMFCDEIKIMYLEHCGICFKLTNTENNFISCKLISNCVDYDTSFGNKKIKSNHEHIIQTLETTIIDCLDKNNQFISTMYLCGVYKGFFFECDNVNEINEIKLILNNYKTYYYNKFLIKKKCILINQSLLYLPLNYEKSYISRTKNDFEGSLKINVINLIVKLNNQQSKLYIYSLGTNMLRYLNGFAGLAYNDYDCDYNCDYNYDYYQSNKSIQSNKSNIYNHQISHDFYDFYDKCFFDKKKHENYSFYIKTSHDNMYIYKKIIHKNIIYKPIENNNKLQCCITLTNIKKCECYVCCTQCNNNFNVKSLIKIFYNKKCPICKIDMCDFDVYINSVKI